jgi:hypothetical protein
MVAHVENNAPLWQLSRVNRIYDRETKKARKAGATAEQREEIQQGWWAESDELGEDLEALRTRRLTRKAYRLDVAVPHRPSRSGEENESWGHGHMTGEWYLTVAGINTD